MDHILRQQLGFTEKDEYYSNLIREGIIDRNEALRIEHDAAKSMHCRNDAIALLRKLRLPVNCQEFIISQ